MPPAPSDPDSAFSASPSRRWFLLGAAAAIALIAGLLWMKKSPPLTPKTHFSYQLLTDAQLETIGKNLTNAFTAARSREALRTLDLPHLLHSVQSQLTQGASPLPAAAQKLLARRLESQPHDLWPMPAKSQAHWLGWRESAIGRVGLLRVLYADGSFSYYGLDPRRGGASPDQLADYYSFTSGLWLSESLALLATTMSELSPSSGWSHFFSQDTPLSPEEKKSLTLCLNAQTWSAFDLAYQSLPERLRQSRSLVRHRQQMARSASADITQRVMRESAALFPDDPAHDFFMIDVSFAAGDFPQMQQLITRCEDRLGGDAYLRALRAYTALRQGDLPLAEKLDLEALALEPTLLAVWQVHIKVLSRRMDLSAAHEACLEAAQRFGPEGVTYFPDDADEGLRRLAQHPPYVEWRDRGSKK
jgi:hypothetical protein